MNANSTPTLNAETMTFGIEIECYMPRELCPLRGGYHCGVQIPELPPGWTAECDASLLGMCPLGFQAIEVVSPILSGQAGLLQVQKVYEWLVQRGAIIRRSCGLHVHVGLPCKRQEVLDRLVAAAANLELAFYAATGTKNRERGDYCRSVKNSHCHRSGYYSAATRYHYCNVNTLRNTVEFRCFSATLQSEKAITYIRMALAVVERSLTMKKKVDWDAKPVKETSPVHRKGPGATALARFFYWAGWTRGRVNTPFGMAGSGIGPDLVWMKAELWRLAAKYDEML